MMNHIFSINDLSRDGYAVAFVANQTIAPDLLAEAGRDLLGGREAPGRVLVVTSHEMFPAEIATLTDAGLSGDVVSFATLLSDQAQEDCDELASASLLSCLNQPLMQARYVSEFMAQSQRLKNEAILRLLTPFLEGAAIRHVAGIGVAGEVWKRAGSRAIPVSALPDPPYPGGPSRLTIVSAANETAVFLSSVSRLRISEGTTVTVLPFPENFFDIATSAPSEARGRIFRLVKDIAPAGWRLATTIHGYSPWMASLAPFIEIFVDGYHPPNYPRSYLDGFAPGAVFRTNDAVSAQWFTRHGRQVRGSSLVEAPFIPAPVSSPARPRRVIFALNHAGDWSSLINRSDTDRLVKAAEQLARALPEMEVIVRAHPTMAYSPHEGSGSLQRLRTFIDDQALPNLELSDATLEEDFARGDIFISEYSQVLIDAWRRGKLGLVANFSGRRSFLQAYEDLGFPGVQDGQDMIREVETMTTQPSLAIERQAAAALRHRDLTLEDSL
ncbi:hypothetical protein ACM64Y_09145 [Novispirillum sp. DQ9]|uniref:hypothetical protein n=1 Tax=Novispirillum sp. DQ9 TaxID=3398612 RepID=UPI003C79F04E